MERKIERRGGRVVYLEGQTPLIALRPIGLTGRENQNLISID